MISFQKTIPYYYYYLVYESKKLMQGRIIVSFLKCITSYYRCCNLQRNSEALKSKITRTYLCTYTRAHTHTTHEEHWHIHKTYTFARARAGRYSSCTQQVHSLPHTLCTQFTNTKTHTDSGYVGLRTKGAMFYIPSYTCRFSKT